MLRDARDLPAREPAVRRRGYGAPLLILPGGRIEPPLDLPPEPVLDIGVTAPAAPARPSDHFGVGGVLLSLMLHGLVATAILTTPSSPREAAGEAAIEVTLIEPDAVVGDAEADDLAGGALAAAAPVLVAPEPHLTLPETPPEIAVTEVDPTAVAADPSPISEPKPESAEAPAPDVAAVQPPALEPKIDPVLPSPANNSPEGPPEIAPANALKPESPSAPAEPEVANVPPDAPVPSSVEAPLPLTEPDQVAEPVASTPEPPVPPGEGQAPPVANVVAARPDPQPVADLLPRSPPKRPVSRPLPETSNVRTVVRADPVKPVVPRAKAPSVVAPSPPSGSAPAAEAEDGGRARRTKVAGTASAGGGGGAAISDFSAWSSRVRAAIQSARVPTPDIDDERLKPARITFSVGRSGTLISASLTVSSGHAGLDAAALAKVRRAAPFPTVPEGTAAPITLSLPVAIRLD